MTASHRGQGLGRSLLVALSKLAVQRGCNRIDWTTSHNNVAAQNLYNKIGAKPQPTTIIYRLEDEDLLKLASAD